MGGAFQWPSVSVVLDYRQKVRDLVINVIEKAPLKLPITMDHPWVSDMKMTKCLKQTLLHYSGPYFWVWNTKGLFVSVTCITRLCTL